MKKHYIFCLSLSLLLMGCDDQIINSNQNSSDSSSEEVVEKVTYATINSTNDVVYLYGLVGESFDLSTIDTSRVCLTKPTFKCESDGVSIVDETLNYLKTGIYNVGIYENQTFLATIQVVINDSEETRYNYPEIDLTTYTQRSGVEGITVTDNKVTIAASGTTWNRITYPIEKYSSLNYSVSCDVTFKQTADSTRWFGLVFRSSTSGSYYQLDIRRNPKVSNSIELTYVSSDGKYSYPYTGTWGTNGPQMMFDENTPIHMEVTLNGYVASCLLSTGEYSKSFEVNLPTLDFGEFGFQTVSSTVDVTNVKVSLNDEAKISSFANPKNSYVNINDNITIDSLKPQLILTGDVFEDLFIINHEYQQIYFKLKANNGVNLYDINDKLMNVNFNQLINYALGKLIVNAQVDDEQTLKLVSDVFNSYGLVDGVIWSSDTNVLKQAHKLMPQIRLGYIPTNLKSFETFDEIGNVCRTAGKHYANQILIDSNILNKENVNKAKGLGFSVVANAKNGENYSLIDSALDGCSLILVAANKDSRDQSRMLYDNTIFEVSKTKQSLFSAPYVTGHRGAGNTGSNNKTKLPENTIESFKYALNNGANAIEIDIHTTFDDKLAIIHNETTGEYSNQNLTVKSSTLAQLQAIPLKMGDGTLSNEYKIPSLNELFEALNDEKYKDKTMVIEVKDNLSSTGIKALELAKEMNWYNRITFITFSNAAAAEIRKYDPGVQVGFLGDAYRRDNKEYWIANNSYYNLGVSLASGYGFVSKESIQEANARGQVEWLWTFNQTTSSQLMNLISYGNKAFTTNYVSDFSNNNYKIEADSLSINKNQTKQLTANAISYIGNKTNITDFEIIVLSDNATSNGSSITRTGDGDIYVVVKYDALWKMDLTSKTFVIYSDIVKIN